MGNLGVLRGSHFAMQEFFATQDAAGGPMGPGGPFWPREDFNAPNGHGVRHYPDYVREAAAGSEGAEYTIDGKVWPKPMQVLLHPGDVAVVLYHVPHNATRNMSDEVMDGLIVPRYQCYFRVTNGKRAGYMQPGGAAAKEALLDPWVDWEGLQRDLPQLHAERKQMLVGEAGTAQQAKL